MPLDGLTAVVTFHPATLDALRQPLEDRLVTIARVSDTVEYPADFILVATEVAAKHSMKP